ncbi:hypothetical protein SAMN05421747_13315 [Parapedobacter composti]|uniref:Uncharacterized protein n=1 Tax=Parapedobacter composti TaxID=623281 RepID=A0A1I1MES3_9SPHI|nr:hypothetical protein SAMN05421747_13315 [Parapedobacter composti]
MSAFRIIGEHIDDGVSYPKHALRILDNRNVLNSNINKIRNTENQVNTLINNPLQNTINRESCVYLLVICNLRNRHNERKQVR